MTKQVPGTSGESPGTCFKEASRTKCGLGSDPWPGSSGTAGPAPGPGPAHLGPARPGPARPDPGRTSRPPVAPRAPEVVEAFLVPFEKPAQVEVRAVLLVPFL